MDPEATCRLGDVAATIGLDPSDVSRFSLREGWCLMHIDFDLYSDVEPPENFAWCDWLIENHIGARPDRRYCRFSGQIPTDDGYAKLGMPPLQLANERYTRAITQMKVDDR